MVNLDVKGGAEPKSSRLLNFKAPESLDHFAEQYLSTNVRYQEWMIDKGFIPDEKGKVIGGIAKLCMGVGVGADVLETVPLLTGNRALMQTVIAGDGRAFEACRYVSPALKANREFMKFAIEQHREAFQYANENLRADPELALSALVEGDVSQMKHASSDLRANERWMSRAIRVDSDALSYGKESPGHFSDSGSDSEMAPGHSSGSTPPSESILPNEQGEAAEDL